MKVLGIESSCDECAAAVVEDGKHILSNVVVTQIPHHAPYNGVVPELASRMHTEWIYEVVERALTEAHCQVSEIDGVAVTAHPGLLGSLLVGVSFAKAFAYARNLPFVAVNHMLAHLYAPLMTEEVTYPFLGLLVSGGHSILCKVEDFDTIEVLGTTIDDAVGEAFDKVAKYYGFGYPGGVYIDRLAQKGDSEAFRFPLPNLYKGEHRYDVSYSGLKTAVINQIDQFRVKEVPRDPVTGNYRSEDVAASFQKAAIEILLRALFRAVEDTGLRTVVIGGGVAANSYLRQRLAAEKDLRCLFPPLSLCGDNGAMVAGIGFRYLARGDRSPWTTTAAARVRAFKRRYP
ncbi:tRNA (adenosine(37)-N6)-threonylcarbamoyltransferase complex transferase subunit TsaD [Treponema sp. J25]|uniref:tRNA (adenosine(37)-N6)-threonylcarbamoyltransferase complex transferase subunit TsaD n=1 Tax=Treponema sp. J25 TaxID=2094121 RepID=UPI001052B8CF|nr:tRNA (adenosine(37)-N6)-threonylcarbamoyltransferase complex transferase subunit TsaD [Treponema sp. J25]TCW60411.1 tRNA (adenosine(37)-N6)-threonylcarbamoyltransferase complex transferase subunit TsaD [Treponema sp. J25]